MIVRDIDLEAAHERLKSASEPPLVLPLSHRLRALATVSERRLHAATTPAERIAERGRLAGLQLAATLAEEDEARRVVEHAPRVRRSQATVGTRPWSRKESRCVSCGTDEIRHYARGLCTHCYYKQHWQTRPDRAAVLEKRQRRRRGGVA